MTTGDHGTVVMTGATGLIGRELCRLLRGIANVHALTRSTPPDDPGVKWLRHDLAAPGLPESMPSRVDGVVHLAQSSHFREFPDRARDIFEVNVGSTARLLDWARGAGASRFVYASSGGIYGHGEGEFREDDAVGTHGPLGYYLASKQCAELLVENYAKEMTVIILRFFFVYGPGQRESMLIPRLVGSVRDGRAIRLQQEEGIRLNPIFVTDAASAVRSSLGLEESQKINIAGPEVLTLREVGCTIGKRIGRDPVFEVDAGTTPNHLVGDTGKMARLLSPPPTRFADGLERMLGAEAR